MKTKYLVIISVILSIILPGITLSDSAFADDVFHLGVALGLSGTGAPYSKEAVEGIEIAVNEINASGGLLGEHRIRLHIRDTETDPQVARLVVEKLIQNDKVRTIIATYSSATAL
ncbi:MAG: ABC transporter substrate-binding protein, partial [Desulfobacterales bacterium]|nr:ABC transporter substrate-binding protein [Desulfobacterales bacterium]